MIETTQILLEVDQVKKYFPFKKFLSPLQQVKAVDGVSFQLKKGRTLGIVGESGCGKSTLGRLLLQIAPPTSGHIKMNNRPLESLSKKELCQFIQMVFQDPYSSINPRKKAWQIVAEPLMIHSHLTSNEYRQAAYEIMEKVGLSSSLGNRYPHMFSGGQRQRLGLARALIMHPQILCLDEPLSALDVSIQAQVINLLLDLQEQFNLSYIFISHDLSVVRYLCDDVIVMYLGKVVEYAPTEELFQNPLHPYTQALLKATPSLKRKITNHQIYNPPLQGEIPSPISPPSGCSFHKRCPVARPDCKEQTPQLLSVDDQIKHEVACPLAKKEKI